MTERRHLIMPGFYMRTSNISTSTVSKSAYNSRSRIKDLTLNRTFDYSSKKDHIFSHIEIPDGCPGEWKDKKILWNENEKVETEAGTKRHGKGFIIAIPQTLSHEEAESCVIGFQKFLSELGYASEGDIHEPDSKRSSDVIEKNRHVHILTTGRKIEKGKFLQVKEKKVFANQLIKKSDGSLKAVYNDKLPDAKSNTSYRVPVIDAKKKSEYEKKTGEKLDVYSLYQNIIKGSDAAASTDDKKVAEDSKAVLREIQKTRERKGKGTEYLWERDRIQDNPLDRKDVIVECRKKWEELCNRYLSQEEKIDHRSYEEQGVDIIPEIHEGIGSHKESDARKEYNEEVKEANQMMAEQKKEAAELIRKSQEVLSHGDGRSILTDVTNSKTDGRDQEADRSEHTAYVTDSTAQSDETARRDKDIKYQRDEQRTDDGERKPESREQSIRRRFAGVRSKYEDSGQRLRERRYGLRIRIAWIFKRSFSVFRQIDELIDWLNKKIDEIARLVVSGDDISKSNILSKSKTKVQSQSIQPAEQADDEMKQAVTPVNKTKQATPHAANNVAKPNKPKRTIRRGKPLEEGNRLIIKVGDDKLTADIYTLETVYGVYRIDFYLNREPLDTVVVLKSSTMYDAIMSSEKVQAELSRLRSRQKAVESNQGINDSQAIQEPSERLYEPQKESKLKKLSENKKIIEERSKKEQGQNKTEVHKSKNPHR